MATSPRISSPFSLLAIKKKKKRQASAKTYASPPPPPFQAVVSSHLLDDQIHVCFAPAATPASGVLLCTQHILRLKAAPGLLSHQPTFSKSCEGAGRAVLTNSVLSTFHNTTHAFLACSMLLQEASMLLESL